MLLKVLAALDGQQRPAPACRPKVSAPRFARLRHWLPRFGLTAVGTVLLVAVICWVLGGNVSTASADFREMLEKVRQATTVTCNFIVRVAGEPEHRAEVAMAPGKSRATWDDGRVHIGSREDQQILTLSRVSRRALLVESSSNAAYQEALDSLRGLSESAGQLAGWEEINGRQVEVYEAHSAHGLMKIWVDPIENLPVRLEIRSSHTDGRETAMVLDDLRWDPPLADSLFAMEVPVGYSLEQPDTEGKEEDLRQLLRICAESGEGRFPDALDAMTVLQSILKWREVRVGRVPEAGGVTTGDFDAQMKEVYRSYRRGLAFVAKIEKSGTWQYAGSGVTLGDSAAIVCWWKPAGATTYRVLYGDLRAEDVEEAPSLESDPSTGPPSMNR